MTGSSRDHDAVDPVRSNSLPSMSVERRGLRTLRTTAGKVGRDRYVLKWIKERYLTSISASTTAPRVRGAEFRDVYLGRIPRLGATTATPAQLSAAAYGLRRKLRSDVRSSLMGIFVRGRKLWAGSRTRRASG